MFKPYFSQYESWRDIGLNYAQKNLNNDIDIIILTLDFKRYFYSVDIDKNLFESILDSSEYVIFDCFNDDKTDKLIRRLYSFIYYVIEKYKEIMPDNNNILLIGFLPFNILANWYLKEFDDAVINRWNPIYYGRYVDDVIIVDKVEKNSEIYIKARKNMLNKDNLICYYLCNCNDFKNNLCEKDKVLPIYKDDSYYANPYIMRNKKYNIYNI